MMKIEKSNATKAVVGTTVAAGVLAIAGAAGAQTYPDPAQPTDPEPEVRAVPLTPADDSSDNGGVATPAVQSTQQLPVTGGDAATIALLGSVLVAGGGVLVWRSKGASAEA